MLCLQHTGLHLMPFFTLGNPLHCLCIWLPSSASWEGYQPAACFWTGISVANRRSAQADMHIGRKKIYIYTYTHTYINTIRGWSLAMNHFFQHSSVSPQCSIPPILCPSAALTPWSLQNLVDWQDGTWTCTEIVLCSGQRLRVQAQIHTRTDWITKDGTEAKPGPAFASDSAG